VLSGEPNDIFSDWREFIPKPDKQNKLYNLKRVEMTERKSEDSFLSEYYLGSQYIKQLPEGLRLYKTYNKRLITQPMNTWLKIIGVLLMVGIMGFILERRLYKNV
jgi:hypothetical protein